MQKFCGQDLAAIRKSVIFGAKNVYGKGISLLFLT